VSAESTNVLELCDVALPTGFGLPVSLRFAPGRLHLLVSDPVGECDALLRVIGLLDLPESGEILVEGRETRGLDEGSLAGLRAQRFGFVFRAPFLLTSFSVIENVAMPLFKVSQVGPEEARRRTERLLAFTGMAAAGEAAIEDLTLGAQFHVALARGLINEPSVLLVEDLDGTLAGEDLEVFAMLLRRAAAEFGTTVIATASPAFARRKGDRVIELVRGTVAHDSALLTEPEA
jgi:lipoprotein-releasing system ATP-binding protein